MESAVRQIARGLYRIYGLSPANAMFGSRVQLSGFGVCGVMYTLSLPLAKKGGVATRALCYTITGLPGYRRLVHGLWSVQYCVGSSPLRKVLVSTASLGQKALASAPLSMQIRTWTRSDPGSDRSGRRGAVGRAGSRPGGGSVMRRIRRSAVERAGYLRLRAVEIDRVIQVCDRASVREEFPAGPADGDLAGHAGRRVEALGGQSGGGPAHEDRPETGRLAAAERQRLILPVVARPDRRQQARGVTDKPGVHVVRRRAGLAGHRVVVADIGRAAGAVYYDPPEHIGHDVGGGLAQDHAPAGPAFVEDVALPSVTFRIASGSTLIPRLARGE